MFSCYFIIIFYCSARSVHSLSLLQSDDDFDADIAVATAALSVEILTNRLSFLNIIKFIFAAIKINNLNIFKGQSLRLYVRQCVCLRQTSERQ